MAQFLAHLGNRFGRKEIEKWLEEIESYQFVKEDWKNIPEDKGSQFKKSVNKCFARNNSVIIDISFNKYFQKIWT